MTRRFARPPVWREYFVLGLLFTGLVVIALKVVHIQTVERGHLHAQGDARYLREITVLPQRGQILDRNGQVLAVSTPVESLWAEPGVFCAAGDSWKSMPDILELDPGDLKAACERRKGADFMYVKRRIPPAVAKEVMALNIPGLERQREYRRYYPDGPVGAHLIGFTDVDDTGQEGLESRFDRHLAGVPGRKRVLKDVAGHFVESVESIQQVRHGENLRISVDQRVQFLAAAYLEKAVKKHKASGGSVVVLSVPSGEILAMVTSPQFNPNDRGTIRPGVFRNRTVTDVVEPGSTSKPFTVAMALESGQVGVDTMVNTAPGMYQIGGRTIRDVHDYGDLSVFDVLVRSSNIGTAKIALAFPFDRLFDTLSTVGFNEPASDLPGEVKGVLVRRNRPIEHATISYGYGFSVTPLQLARAYTAFATDGELLPVTLEPRPEGYRARGIRVFSKSTVQQIRAMMEKVATPEGTARRARIQRYRVGGKTGTTHKLVDGNYDNNEYISLFAGLAPLSDPRFVTVVTVDNPRGGDYYGGVVAAPVFAELMQDLMRLYNIPPDSVRDTQITTIDTGDNPA
ncbi:MAG: penicillin-binding transpeptidase domain-containing protein [Gammaproteobacteria bacterium]|nr:penicillin-binding transpeptidase domain-containing protein [Gammaproteobacteria bacterium]